MSDPKTLEEAVTQANALIAEFDLEYSQLEQLAAHVRTTLSKDAALFARLRDLKSKLGR